MNNATAETLSYYESNAKGFVESTANVEFGALQGKFASMLPRGGRILDLGCGSGRDSLAFLQAGFSVDAMDGSEQMVAAASALTGLPVTHALFDQYQPQGEYDGIWACSSLLHVPAQDLPGIIAKYARHLKQDGIFYMSFKLGSHEGMRNGRWFTDLNEDSFCKLIDQIEGLQTDHFEITADVRPGRAHEQWLNAWCVRTRAAS